MTGLYAVVCECDGEGKSGRLIAWIDDRRPQAEHVFIQSNTGFTKSLGGKQTKAGAWHSYTFRCRGCSLDVQLSEVTADEIIDKLIPTRDMLAFRPIPSLHQPDRRSGEQRAADQARMAKLIEDQLHGRNAPVPMGLPYEGPFEVYESRYVIPFDFLNRIITRLRSRGGP